MFKQKYRKNCLAAIVPIYKEPALMCDRLGQRMYYSIWKSGDKLLEVTSDGEEIEVYEWHST